MAVTVLLGIEILLFAHSLVFRLSGLAQVALLIGLQAKYTDSFNIGIQPHAVILALVLIQSTLVELRFFELSILALLAHGTIAMTTFTRMLAHGALHLAGIFAGIITIFVVLMLDILRDDVREFVCLFGLSNSGVVLYVLFFVVCIALSLEWTRGENSL